jgi:hypothetical protein
MVNNLFLLKLIFLCNTLISVSQINICFNENCPDYNSRVITKTIIENLNKEITIQLLEQEVNLLFLFKVDTLGKVLGLESFRATDLHMHDSVIINFIDNHIVDKTNLYICYQSSGVTNDRESYKIIRRDIIQKGFAIVPVRVPPLYFYYKYKKDDKTKESKSVYNYLLKQLEEKKE